MAPIEIFNEYSANGDPKEMEDQVLKKVSRHLKKRHYSKIVKEASDMGHERTVSYGCRKTTTRKKQNDYCLQSKIKRWWIMKTINKKDV